jgi:hypothetical protein
MMRIIASLRATATRAFFMPGGTIHVATARASRSAIDDRAGRVHVLTDTG